MRFFSEFSGSFYDSDPGYLQAGEVRSSPQLCVCELMHDPLTSDPHRKTLSVRIIDQEQYDKKATFYVELQEPYWDRRRWTGVRTRLHLSDL